MTLDVTSHLVPVVWGLLALVLVSAGLFVAAALGALRPARPTRRSSLTGRGPLRHTTRAVRSIG